MNAMTDYQATRTYTAWQAEAHDLKEATLTEQTRLANELREHWDDWKADSDYPTWDACIQGELGVTADALRHRNDYHRKHPHEDSHAEQPLATVTELPVAKSASTKDKLKAAKELVAQGKGKSRRKPGSDVSYREAAEAVGMDESTIRRDPEIRAERLKVNPEAHSTTNYTSRAACSTLSAAEQLHTLSEDIGSVEIEIDYLTDEQYYTLNATDKKALKGLLNRIISKATTALEGLS